MKSHEETVRAAACALKSAIGDAEKAGYKVAWPRNAVALDAIGISETGARAAVVAREQVAEKPKTFGGGRSTTLEAEAKSETKTTEPKK